MGSPAHNRQQQDHSRRLVRSDIAVRANGPMRLYGLVRRKNGKWVLPRLAVADGLLGQVAADKFVTENWEKWKKRSRNADRFGHPVERSQTGGQRLLM